MHSTSMSTTGDVPFGYGLTAGLATQSSPGFNRQFTCVTHAELAWPLVRRPAGRVRARPRGTCTPPSVGDVVGRASDRTVTSPACRPRLPLVAQRVTAVANATCDKAIRDFIALGRAPHVSRRCTQPTFDGLDARDIATVPLETFRGFPSRHPPASWRICSSGLRPRSAEADR